MKLISALATAAGILGLGMLGPVRIAGAHSGDGGDPAQVHACVVSVLLAVRIVGSMGSCVAGKETAVHWSIQGPPGPQGPQGPAGSGGFPSFDQLAGLACTAPGGQAGAIEITYRIGVARLRCLVPGVRFIDNADGTITDQQTRLMWEKKVATAGCPSRNCANDTYTWGAAMGSYLDRLNGRLVDFVDGTFVDASGYSGYGDWRLPTIAELHTITDTSVPGCAARSDPCIPPIFGATGPQLMYWSASNHRSLGAAWAVNLFEGTVLSFNASFAWHVRAVRNDL